MKKRLLTIALCLGLLASMLCLPASAASYPDVGSSDWYATYIDACTSQGILNGYEDGTFQPNSYLRRGEFIKMLCCSASYAAEGGSVHWAEGYWNTLNNRGLLANSGITDSYDSLQGTISRYEMAVLIYNFIKDVRCETLSDTSGAAQVIPDYSSIPSGYQEAVAQVYAKGIINGMSNTSGVADGSFCGDKGLTRGQGAAVMVRLLNYGQRLPSDLSSSDSVTVVETVAETTPETTSNDVTTESFYSDGSNPYRLENAPNGTTPFAIWARENGLMDSWNNTSAELNEMLTGHSDRAYFYSAAEAAPYVTTVTVNVWRLDSSGNKYASTASVTVHKYVAADIYDIFQTIFNSSEQFPISSLGGLRCSDTMRHAYGMAIDINADYNCQGYNSGSTISCGSGWWPLGTERTAWAGSLTEASPYSIGYGSSVVNAFAAYGWGWLCETSSGYADFMHFSFRSDGG